MDSRAPVFVSPTWTLPALRPPDWDFAGTVPGTDVADAAFGLAEPGEADFLGDGDFFAEDFVFATLLTSPEAAAALALADFLTSPS